MAEPFVAEQAPRPGAMFPFISASKGLRAFSGYLYMRMQMMSAKDGAERDEDEQVLA
jgi:hypothetical protein